MESPALVRCERRATGSSIQEISHNVPAAPETAQIAEVEGRRKERGREAPGEVSLCCSTVSSRPGSIPSGSFRLRIT